MDALHGKIPAVLVRREHLRLHVVPELVVALPDFAARDAVGQRLLGRRDGAGSLSLPQVVSRAFNPQAEVDRTWRGSGAGSYDRQSTFRSHIDEFTTILETYARK